MALPNVLTLIADRAHGPLNPAVVRTARDMLGGAAPIELSPGEAVDIPCPSPGPGAPGAAALRAAFAPHRVDAIFQRVRGRRKAVLIADMDSTIVANETLDDLAALAGCGEAVAAITQASMNGEIEFEDALRQRVALLKGRPATLLKRAWSETRINPDARTVVQTMRRHNARTALVSGGFTWFTARVAEACGFDEHHGNALTLSGDTLAGTLHAEILGPDAKRLHLERLAEERGVKLSATCAIGDGANDIPMLTMAGLGLAFHGKPRVRAVVERQINFTGLRTVLFAQGYPAASFVE
jgi:phosphoserine phosphatase